MAVKKVIDGVIAAALTPLNPDGSIALEDLPLLLDFLARRGCHGALLLGTTGEGPSFAREERIAIAKRSLEVRAAYPDFLLLAGTGTPSIEETIALNRTIFDLGFDGVVVLPPYYFRKATEPGLLEWFSQVIRRSVPVGSAFLLYHIPGTTGIEISPDLIARLMDLFPDHRIGIKDSTADADHAVQLGTRFGRDLLTLNGTDSLFDLALEHSAAGCITAMANLRSPDLRRVYDQRQKGGSDPDAVSRLKTARGVMNRYAPFPPLYKALIHRLHALPQWAVRPPLLALRPELLEAALAEAHQEAPGFDD